MLDDDQLVQDYLAVAVVHALNHLLHDVDLSKYTEYQLNRIVNNLRWAKKDLTAAEKEMVERYDELLSLPF